MKIEGYAVGVGGEAGREGEQEGERRRGEKVWAKSNEELSSSGNLIW